MRIEEKEYTKSIDISIRGGKNRVLGTVIGAAIGAAFAMALPGNAGLCGIGVILTLYLCHMLNSMARRLWLA